MMDIGAFEMCRKAKLPILVFNYKREARSRRPSPASAIGTIVSGVVGQTRSGTVPAASLSTRSATRASRQFSLN